MIVKVKMFNHQVNFEDFTFEFIHYNYAHDLFVSSQFDLEEKLHKIQINTTLSSKFNFSVL